MSGRHSTAVLDATATTDRLALTELVARLDRALDTTDIATLRRIYTADAVVRSPRGGAEGIDAIVEYLTTSGDPDERTQHLATDVVVDLDGDRAEVSANLVDVFFRPGAPPHLAVGLRYDFDARRTPDGWRFAAATVTPLWRTGDSGVQAPEQAPERG